MSLIECLVPVTHSISGDCDSSLLVHPTTPGAHTLLSTSEVHSTSHDRPVSKRRTVRPVAPTQVRVRRVSDDAPTSDTRAHTLPGIVLTKVTPSWAPVASAG